MTSQELPAREVLLDQSEVVIKDSTPTEIITEVDEDRSRREYIYDQIEPQIQPIPLEVIEKDLTTASISEVAAEVAPAVEPTHDIQIEEFAGVDSAEVVDELASGSSDAEYSSSGLLTETIDEQIYKILVSPEPEIDIPKVEFDLVDHEQVFEAESFDAEIEEFWSSMTRPESVNAIEVEHSIFGPDFLDDEADRLDEILNFGVDTQLTISEGSIEVKVPQQETKFTEIISKQAQILPEAERDKVIALMEQIESTATKIIDIYQAKDSIKDPELLAILEAEIEEYTTRLLLLFDRPIDNNLVKRFIQRVLNDKKKQTILNVDVDDFIDEGTHEKKLSLSEFISDMTVTIDNSRQNLLSAIGMYALIPTLNI